MVAASVQVGVLVISRRESQLVPKAHPTVDRVVAILEAVAFHPDGVHVADLVRQVDIPKSTVHTLVQGLLATDYLSQRGGTLHIGTGVEMLSASRAEPALQRLAHPELQRLAAETGETAQLAVRAGDVMLVLDQVESSQVIRYTVPPRARRPLLNTSMGKLFLAELDDASLDAFLDKQGEAGSPGAKTLLSQREQIRNEQVAYNDEESVDGVYAVGAAIRGGTETLLAALVIVGPAFRLRPQADAARASLRAAADRLCRHLKRR